MLAKELSCPACGWRTVAGSTDLATRLRLIGQLRREAEPADGLIEALLPEAVGRMTCPGCKAIGLRVTDAVEEDYAWDDWQAATLCEACRKPIPPERLEALPGSKRCVGCQGLSESGADDADEPEFCPRCGSLMELRVSGRGGPTRYRLFCTGGCRGELR